MRILRALAAQVTLLLCVVGLPLLLAATIGNPLHGLGSLREGQVTDAVVIDLLAGLAYLCWAQFVLAVLTELAAALRHAGTPAARHLPRPRRVPGVFASQQHLAHSLVVAALLLLPTLSSASLPLRMPTVGPAASLPTVTASWQQHIPSVSPTAPARQPRQHTSARRLRHGPTSYRPSGGPATYWDLATTFLGSGERWEQIWHLNEGRTQADGAVMDSPNLLRPGWTVLLPRPPSTPGSTTDQQAAAGTLACRHGAAGRQLRRTRRSRRRPDWPNSGPPTKIDSNPTDNTSPTPP